MNSEKKQGVNKGFLKGALAAGSIYVIYGLNSVFCKDILVDTDISPALLYALRILGATTLMWLVGLFVKKETIEPADRWKIIPAALLCMVVPQYATLYGLQQSTPFDASLVSTLKPILTFLIACSLGRETFKLKSLSGILLALGGMLLLVLDTPGMDSSFRTSPAGLCLLLLNGISFSLYLVLFRPLIKRYSTFTLMRWMLLVATFICIPLAIPDMHVLSGIAAQGKVLSELAFIILLATFAVYLLMPVGQRNLSASQYSLFAYLQCIVASVAGIAMGLDVISWQKIAALLLFVAGISIVRSATELR